MLILSPEFGQLLLPMTLTSARFTFYFKFSSLSVKSGNIPIKSGNIQIKSGNIPIKSGNIPIKSGNNTCIHIFNKANLVTVYTHACEHVLFYTKKLIRQVNTFLLSKRDSCETHDMWPYVIVLRA